MIAETASLMVKLGLEDTLSAGASRAKASIAGLGTSAGSVASGPMALLQKASGGIGSAMSTLKGRVSQLGTGLLALGGVGGLLGVSAVLTSSIRKVEDFGAALEKVTTLTGESAMAAGTLVLAFQKFGLGADTVAQVVGFTEKTLGKLDSTAVKAGSSVSKLDALDVKYGLHLVDASGRVADFSSVLEQVAAYYDSSASASDKAYLASQVFGRGYTQMIPILNEGAAGLREAAAEAEALGLSSTDTVGQLAAFHDQMHALEQQANVLQLAIGTALLPSLIDLSKAATDFISGHRADLVAFFKNAASAARTLAGAALGFGSAVKGAWDSIPPEMRDLLVKAFVGDRIIKWTFGVDIIGSVGKLLLGGIGDVLKGTLGSFLQRGSPANPMFVAAEGGALGGGGAGGGLLGTVMKVAVVGIAAGVAYELWQSFQQQSSDVQQQGASLVQQAQAQHLTPLQAQQELSGIYAQLNGDLLTQFALVVTNPFNHGLDNLNATVDALRAQLEKATSRDQGYNVDNTPPAFGSPVAGNGLAGAVRDQGWIVDNAIGRLGGRVVPALDALHRDFQSQIHTLKTSSDPRAVKAAADKAAADIVKGVGSLATTNRTLETLRAAQKAAIASGNTALAKALGVDIAKVEAKVPGRQYVERQIAQAQRVIASGESGAKKLDDLKAIQRDLIRHGDATAAKEVGKLTTIAQKKWAVSVHTTNNISTSVSVRDTASATRTHNSYDSRSAFTGGA